MAADDADGRTLSDELLAWVDDTFETNGLPDGFHRAAARVYRRLAGFKGQSTPDIDEVLTRLLED